MDNLPDEADMERPRCHHYTFAHIALRQIAFDSPVQCVGTLASPHATEFLCRIWESVDEHCQERGETSTIQPREILVHPIQVAGYPCVIVEMPEPWFITGAYLIAIVLKVETVESLEDTPASELLYYTLEKGAELDGSGRTVLCAWTESGSHCNYGDGPEPTVEALVECLEEKLEPPLG